MNNMDTILIQFAAESAYNEVIFTEATTLAITARDNEKQAVKFKERIERYFNIVKEFFIHIGKKIKEFVTKAITIIKRKFKEFEAKHPMVKIFTDSIRNTKYVDEFYKKYKNYQITIPSYKDLEQDTIIDLKNVIGDGMDLFKSKSDIDLGEYQDRIIEAVFVKAKGDFVSQLKKYSDSLSGISILCNEYPSKYVLNEIYDIKTLFNLLTKYTQTGLGEFQTSPIYNRIDRLEKEEKNIYKDIETSIKNIDKLKIEVIKLSTDSELEIDNTNRVKSIIELMKYNYNIISSAVSLKIYLLNKEGDEMIALRESLGVVTNLYINFCKNQKG